MLWYGEENSQTTVLRRKILDLDTDFWKFGCVPVLRSLIRILHASLVQIDMEIAEKYSNKRYAVDAVQYIKYRQLFVRNRVFCLPHLHSTPSPGDAPVIITQYVAWMERQFNACQTPRSIYLSIFKSFRVIRCISQCVSPKIAIFTKFLFPLGTPLGQSR